MRSRLWRGLLGGGALLVVVPLALVGCVENVTQTPVEQPHQPQNFLEPVGRFAVELDSLWNLVLALVIFVLVEGLLLFSIFRYRERRGEDRRLPKQIHGNPRLEALWTIIPALLLAFVAVPTVRTLFLLADEPPDALRVQVIGHQWWWEFAYPDYPQLKTANILHIPTDRTVFLEMTSADVIHSFWVPKLSGKQDTVPGRISILKLETHEPGTYFGQCAEYCGLSHANMRVRVIATPPDEFDTWARQQATPQAIGDETGLAARGAQLFAGQQCTACHMIRGYPGAGGTVGPDLTYFSDRGWFAGAIFENSDENVRRWLADPPAMKPMQPPAPPGQQLAEGQTAVAGMPDLGLTPDEIEALLAFLRTLRSPAP
ncbi:MAG: cytochrome c oxidase subunit II [Actinomycetota bacterium]|nr:cytochrome c oxidase subunit II [Actinomycetota bacterium]